MRPVVRVQRLPHAGDLPLPAYATAGAAGADLCAALAGPLTIPPGGRAAVPSGFVFEIPDGYEIQVRPRSGLAFRHGITVLNTPGTVDSDYRGEVMAILVNLGAEPFTIRHGDRIAQLVLAPVQLASFTEATGALGSTARGTGGFGSTGV
ncbi:deoxyuridine 5'-triphosphate nucleotidohydrolase [Aureimonas endophytica]|uniref:Deoxyuridine 5'-triphosphate nucleotidohydrolase n=1 Tax=Aureimonas endophytica TaxID=2027858 RepID=A0A917A1Q5_9HYPH|nr:dUTP diphosphatase [Aureimonas endophytica]GGE22189.1 deoxyuridine 5'-triphosphate nucleotidohydrolase [Aureimonas endophytica]